MLRLVPDSLQVGAAAEPGTPEARTRNIFRQEWPAGAGTRPSRVLAVIPNVPRNSFAGSTERREAHSSTTDRARRALLRSAYLPRRYHLTPAGRPSPLPG